jgi:hypothetical protein
MWKGSIHRRHPGIVFHVSDVATPTLELPQLRDRTLDLAVIRTRWPLPPHVDLLHCARRVLKRFGIAHHAPNSGLVFRAGFGIFFTPVDMNTWCNQRHNVPYVFPETQQADNFTPPATLVASGFNFGQPVLGRTTVSFASIELDAPSQYIEQWSTSVEKSLGRQTTLEIGYLGAHGLHLQRAHLINNALPGAGPIGPRRPFKTLSFLPGTVLPSDVNAALRTV